MVYRAIDLEATKSRLFSFSFSTCTRGGEKLPKLVDTFDGCTFCKDLVEAISAEKGGTLTSVQLC